MATKAEQRRADLRVRLVDAAERRIARDGAGALRARDLATDVGCAVGAIYNAIEDLNAIIMAVNLRTFSALEASVSASLDGTDGQSPAQRLIVMSHAYLQFAQEHTQLWRALFDLQMTASGPVPDWYREALADLFRHIAGPLSERFPEKTEAELNLLVRGLFSSVHGIVLLGLEDRISGVPPEQIGVMISEVLGRVAD